MTRFSSSFPASFLQGVALTWRACTNSNASPTYFILAMIVMVAICAFLTYAISAPSHT